MQSDEIIAVIPTDLPQRHAVWTVGPPKHTHPRPASTTFYSASVLPWSVKAWCLLLRCRLFLSFLVSCIKHLCSTDTDLLILSTTLEDRYFNEIRRFSYFNEIRGLRRRADTCPAQPITERVGFEVKQSDSMLAMPLLNPEMPYGWTITF